MGYSTANLCHSRGVTKSHHWPLKALGPLLAHGKHFEWSAMLASNYMHPKTNKLAWHSFSTNIKCLRMVMGNWMMYICLLGTGLWVTYQNVAFLLFIGFVHKIKSEWKKTGKVENTVLLSFSQCWCGRHCPSCLTDQMQLVTKVNGGGSPLQPP